MDADYYLETIQTVFQDFKLVNGTWDVKGVDGKTERVRPQDIKGTALMTVEGELDDISGSGQTRAAQDLCSGVPAKERLHLEVPGAGHYGIFSGRRWRDIVYPQVVKFIQGHSGKKSVSSPAKAAPVKTVTAPAPAPVTAKAVVKVAAKAPAKRAKKPVAPATVQVADKPTVKAAAKPTAKVAAKSTAKAPTAAKTKPAVKTSWVETKKKA
jgi:poly(3-hydroxybutyrate) depolymerase